MASVFFFSRVSNKFYNEDFVFMKRKEKERDDT